MLYKITLQGETVEELITALKLASVKLISQTTTTPVTATTTTTPTTLETETTKIAKTTKAAKITTPEDTATTTKTKSTTWDLDMDVIPAFKEYAKKHTREKAAEILASYNVKSVRDLNPKDYVNVMETLDEAYRG